MKNRKFRDAVEWSALGLAAVVGLGLLVGVPWSCGKAYHSYGCRQQWRESGMRVRYEWIGGGCQVETKPGVWIPADRYRVMP